MRAHRELVSRCFGVTRWADHDRSLRRALSRLAVAAAVLVGILLVAGCGGGSRQAGSNSQDRQRGEAALWVAPSEWPDAADYQTIKVAVSVRDRALLQEPDWRRKAGLATAAMLTLTSLRGHFLPGTCATFINGLYDELLSLSDGYQGEDWRPLVQWVRQHETFEASCRRPPSREPGL
jgi:hypothetical protein